VPGLANASRITAATYHTCTLEGTVGAAYCWGANVRGQLGNGTIEPRLSPAGVLGLVGAWDLSAGSMHTCAAMGPAGVSCWGQNANHQLGDDGTMLRLVPGVVLGSLGTVYQVSAGEAHTCAVRDGDKTVWCWGWNSAGQLGDGTQVERGLPVRAGTLTGVVEVAAGSEYSCARTSTAVHCWGLNYHGALGDGSTTNRLSPVAVSLPGIPTSLAVGWQHTCAGLDDGTLWCWGLNFYAQLGDGTQGNSAAPVPVLLDADSATPLDDVVDVSVNWGATCALRGDGTVWCWGDNRENNLGLGPVASHMVPSPMLGITGATQVAMGSAHTCVLGPAGTVWCAGANPSGQLGNGERTASLVPVIVPE
jgi:alpha-tubulin suppressor-like RCC1 family protein